MSRNLSHSYLASSTNVERAFSHGGLTVSKMWHSLSDQSVRAATVLGSWSHISQLIPHDEFITVFKEKSRRSRGEKDGIADAEVISVD